ncbi:hypothetical protein ACFQ3S_02820 [Mucilaginibacter terrae]|uniref:hypothetical protein n=1 Tax=Mucilaginibacter terrae TaxID=1955052 RepID=UPI0036398DD8
MNTNETKKSSSKRVVWLTASIVIIVLVILGLNNKLYLRLSYSNLKNNHFETNGNMYASPYAMQVGEVGGIPLLRLVKNSDGKGSPYMVFVKDKITLEPALKTKNTFIGRYIRHEIQDIKFKDQSGMDNFYAIQVEPDVLEKSMDQESEAKSNYVYVNNDYYVIRAFVSDKK